MATYFTADPVNKLLILTTAPTLGVVEINVRRDIYSALKVEWLNDDTLNKYKFPLTPLGGDPLTATLNLGETYFIEYGWRLRPYEADHRLILNGNLFVREGGQVDVSTLGDFQVSVSQFLSNLVNLVDSGAAAASNYIPCVTAEVVIDDLSVSVATPDDTISIDLEDPLAVQTDEALQVELPDPIQITHGC